MWLRCIENNKRICNSGTECYCVYLFCCDRLKRNGATKLKKYCFQTKFFFIYSYLVSCCIFHYLPTDSARDSSIGAKATETHKHTHIHKHTNPPHALTDLPIGRFCLSIRTISAIISTLNKVMPSGIRIMYNAHRHMREVNTFACISNSIRFRSFRMKKTVCVWNFDDINAYVGR